MNTKINFKEFSQRMSKRQLSFHTKLRTFYVFALLFIGILALVAGYHSNVGINQLKDYNKAKASMGGLINNTTDIKAYLDSINVKSASAQIGIFNELSHTGHSFALGMADGNTMLSDGTTVDGIIKFSTLDERNSLTSVVIPLGFISVFGSIIYGIISGTKNKQVFLWSSTILCGLAIATFIVTVIDLKEYTDNVVNYTLVPKGKVASYLNDLNKDSYPTGFWKP